MPGVNFTGGRRNAARQRSRDLTGQKQRDHFQKQRHLAYLKTESSNPVQAAKEPRGPHGICLAHAQQALRRLPAHDESNRPNIQIFAIPAAHGILPTSPQPTSARKRPLSALEQDSSDETFEHIRRRLVACHDLVGIRGRAFKESTSSSTLVPSSAEQEHPAHAKPDELSLSSGPCSSSSSPEQGMDLEPRRAPFCFELTSPNVRTASSLVRSDSAVPTDPWVALRRKSNIDIPPDALDDLLLRDPTYPPPEGFDMPERAGLDFRLTLPADTSDGLLASPAGNGADSESTLCSPPSRITESSVPLAREASPTVMSLRAELVCPRTPLRQRAQILSPLSSHAYSSSDVDVAPEETRAATASDPLSYWLCNDDDVLETPSAPAAVHMAREAMLHNQSVSSVPSSVTRNGRVPGPGTSESHQALYQSSTPVSITPSSPIPGATIRRAVPSIHVAPVDIADARSMTVPFDCLPFPAPDRRSQRQGLGFGLIDDVGSVLLPLSRAETQRPSSPSLHPTLDTIIASAFALTDPAHDAVRPFPVKASSDVDKRAVPRRADVELKFSSFWDEDDEDE